MRLIRNTRNKYIQQVKKRYPNAEMLFRQFEKDMCSQKNKVGSRAFVTALEKGFAGIKWEWRMQDEGPVSVQQDQLVNEGSRKVTAANTQITSGVGDSSAENKKADVMIIQKALLDLGLLNESDFSSESTVVNNCPTPSVEQEKISKTIEAIYRFQSEVLHWQNCDGNISGPDSKTLEEIHAEHKDADYVQKRIALYPTIVAQREAKAEKRKQEKLAAQKIAEQKAAEAARIKAIKDKPATKEAADKFLEQEEDTLEIADKLKEYVSLNPKFVQAVINQFDRMDRDNITFALMNRVSDTELTAGGEDLVKLMRETLTNWFVSWSSYTEEIERLDKLYPEEEKANKNEIVKGISNNTELSIESWMSIATGEIGTKEDTSKTKHNDRIVEYHGTTGKFKDDETPWCSSFVNWVIQKAGMEGTNSAWAKSWDKWGKKISKPAYGALAVIDWSKVGKKGGHVGFVVGKTSSGKIVLLGGKQGNQVKLSAYNSSVIISYVIPKELEESDFNYNLKINDELKVENYEATR